MRRQDFLVLAALTVLYLALVVQPMRQPMWHDELFTFYIAQSPTPARFLDAVQHVDWQPPLIFLTAALSQALFGRNEFATRLPSTLAFFGAGIGLWLFLRRYLGALWAAFPVLLLWFSFYFKYATEARPYGLLASFFILALNSYERVLRNHGTRWPLAGVFLGGFGMMLSHVMAPFSLMPFGAAELVRTLQRRRVDFPVWAAIVSPLALFGIYLPLMQGFEKQYFPPLFQASPKKIAAFYAKAFLYIAPTFAAGWAAALLLPRFFRTTPQTTPPAAPIVPLPLFAFTGALLLPPILINVALMRSAGAFWERYAITTAFGLYACAGVALALFFRLRRSAALAALGGVLIAGLAQTAIRYRPAAPAHLLESIRPDLPMVAASGVSFLGMDHYENPALLNRLFYLTDREAAIRYSHATLFEGFATIHNYFPLRAKVLPYAAFVGTHKRFTVFGAPEDPETWLFKKLESGHATIRPIRQVATPYPDYTVYEVTMPAPGVF